MFVGEVTFPSGEEIRLVDRTTGEAATPFRGGTAEAATSFRGSAEAEAATDADPAQVAADARRVMPLPTTRERRLALRLRASELVGLMESTDATEPETPAARDTFVAELADVGRAAALRADEARAQGLDPLTFRTIALDSGAGANLLEVVPAPGRFSYTGFSTYEACPLQYAFRYVYRMPDRVKASPALEFGSIAHEAFQAFTIERRERAARGEPPPTREDLETAFRARWVPTAFGDRASEERYGRRVDTLLDNFWSGEVASIGEAIAEELDFELTLDPGDGGDPVVVTGSIDRIDRLPSGKVEVIDYKTGKISSQKGVDESLQLSIYALACRDALGLGTPERVTLYFTESAMRLSTTRTDEQLDAVRADLLARVARVRAGEFVATPGDVCRWCDFRAMCPERV
jgi:RecB family exonuclease